MEVRVPVRLSAIDRRHYSDAVIVADLSNDATYAEVLHETFGPRVIGLQISRNCDGMNVERRPVKDRSMLFYTVGRSYLLELYHSELQAYQGQNCRWTNDPDADLRPRSARVGSCTVARQGITMISAFHASCWRGQHAIRIYPIGPTPLWPRAGRADRRLQRLVHWAGHEHLPRFCRLSFGQSKFSRAVWGGFDHFFLRGATLSPPLFPLAREPQLNQPS